MRAFSLGLALFPALSAAGPVTVTFLHNNDLHGHIEPTIVRKKAYGGYARIATLIRDITKREKNVVFLNAGDTFQGTLYFNVYEGLADLAFLNAVGLRAMAVGNHEFDRGPAPLATFARNARFPLLSSNVDVSGEPLLTGLIAPATIIKVGRERIGIVGTTPPDSDNISSPGPTVRFPDLVPSVQRSVDDLTRQGIDKIVLLSHVGYEVDRMLARTVRGVDVIIGGHSHTPLGTPEIDGWPKAGGVYPTYEKGPEGRDVPIVQAWEWGKVLGRLKVAFDSKGRARVLEAKPIVVDETIAEDSEIASLVTAFRKPIEATASQPVAEIADALPKSGPDGDSPMSRVIADAMLAATRKGGAVAAFINSGGVRGGLEAGRATYGSVLSVQPFSNTLVTLDLKGSELRAALDRGIPTGGRLLPSAGTSYAIVGGRATEIVVDGKPLDEAATYRVALLGFTASGGDAHAELKAAPGRRTDTGILDIDALVDHLRANAPVKAPAPRIRERKG